MASPKKIEDKNEWLEIISDLKKDKSLEEIFIFLLHYQSQYTKSKEYSKALLSTLEQVDSLEATEILILKNLQLYAKMEKKATGGNKKRTLLKDNATPPSWSAEKLTQKKHLCPCKNVCQLKESCLLRTEPKRLCHMRYWRRKEPEGLVVDDSCFKQVFLQLWENAKKHNELLDGKLCSKSFYVPFHFPKWDFFLCCNPDCTREVSDNSVAINVNSLSVLVGKRHAYCSHCLDFVDETNPSTACPKCSFSVEESRADIVKILN